MAYRFDGVDDRVEFAVSPFTGYAFGALTMVGLLKRASIENDGLICFTSSGGTTVRTQFTPRGTGAIALFMEGLGNTTSTLTASSTSTWYIVAVTWAGGAAMPRFHVHDGTSWSHANPSSEVAADISAIAGTDRLFVGSSGTGASFLAADVVCAGVKKSDSTDSAIETLTQTGFSSWTGFGFDWLVGFDSSLTSGGVLQDQGSAGTGDEIGKTGTSVVSDPSGWSWAAGPSPVYATRALQYSVEGRVTNTRALQYGISGGAIATRQLNYNVYQSVAAAMHLNYTVAGTVTTTRQLKYTVVGVGRAAAERQLMWGNEGAFETQGRFCIAFNASALEWDEAIFTRLDDTEAYPGLRVAGYSIDRGRQYELDRTDTGRATVQINDRDGILNPRNPDGPFYGQLNPLLQACINRYNPVTGAWRTRFRGYIEDLAYEFDPSMKVNRLTITLVDMFEILAAIEMQDGQFGADITTGDGQITFARARVNDRIVHLLNDCGIQPHARVIFSGNVILQPQPYSAGESPMTVIQEAADGEFPGVSNVFCDRKGRLCFHGRFAKFFPDEVAAGASIGAWDFQRWNAADGAEVASTPTIMAPVRAFGFTRGLAKVINQATATPNGIDDANVAFQLVEDTASIARYGIRSWSATNLVTDESLIDASDELVETKRFATYYVQNYAQPRDRIEGVTFRPVRADDYRAEYLWKLLCEVDISDAMTVTVASPGGGGFAADEYFVEGVHETVQPMGPADDLEDVTLTLDLSPAAYFAANPWPDDDEES